MRLSGANGIRGSVLFCGLLLICLVLGTGSDLHQPWAGPDTVLAGDPDGGEGTPGETPPPPEGGSSVTSPDPTTADGKTVDPDEESDTLVEQFFAEIVDVLSALWR